MIPNMPALGIRFEIGKIESVGYGIECWKLFWRAVDVHKLGGALLFEGDTAASMQGRENVYCIAIQSIDTTLLKEVRVAVEQRTEFQRLAASPPFVESSRVCAEPLADAGKVDSEGNLVGKAFNSRAALGAVLKEREQCVEAQVGQRSTPIPERTKPGSSRTADLPSISSLKKLLEYLLAKFGDPQRSGFWLTPEEICDVVERYADLLQVQWYESTCGLSTDMAYVTLFNKGKTGENILLHGLFPFASESEAKAFCYDANQNSRRLFGKLEGFYGIQGKFAMNFAGRSSSNWVDERNYKKERDIAACDLWPKLWVRMQSFSKEIEESKRREEEKRRCQDEEARKKAEEEKRSHVQTGRKSSGQCVMCGNALGLFQRLLGKDRHGQCTEFKE